VQPEFALAPSPYCDRRHDTVVSVPRRYDRRASRTRSLPGTRLAIVIGETGVLARRYDKRLRSPTSIHHVAPRARRDSGEKREVRASLKASGRAS
jgi:hypothetical protein